MMRHEHCEVHPDTPLVGFCPRCRATHGGKAKSDAKQETARRNGRKGGAPLKATRKTP